MLPRFHRLSRVIAVLVISALTLPLLAQQAAKPAAKPADEKALDAIYLLEDPAARLAAFNKFRKDFPKSDLLIDVDRQSFTLLVRQFSGRTTEIGQAIDRLKSHVKPDTSFSDRFAASMNPARELIANGIMLDRAEALLAEASSVLSFDAFVKAERVAAEGAKRAVPAEVALKTRFAQMYQMPLGEQLGRMRLAKGDLAGAERAFKDAFDLKSPGANPGQGLNDSFGDLASAYATKGDADHADQLLREIQESNPDIQRLYLVRAKYYSERGQLQQAKDIINKRLKMITPPAAFGPGELLLAQLESRTGENDAALARYLRLATSGLVYGPDYDAMVGVYKKVHGNDAGLEGELDRMYRERFPNPIKPEKWTASPKRGPRLVVAQLFTGSGCGPCVAADLSIDAMMERYPADAVVPLLYHVHWPRPDPMTTTSTASLANVLADEGVPTLVIDGKTANDAEGMSLGGGPRAEAPNCYKDFVAQVDKALDVAPTAEISVSAMANGDQIDVTAAVSKLPARAKNLRLHLVVAEKEVKFAGENGIRFHAMVVRATTGEKGEGVPLSGTGTQKHTFQLAAIRDDIVKHLANELDRLKKSSARNAPAPTYAAEGHAMTTIDLKNLVVVAFIQGADRQVLQAARADVR